MHLWVCLCIMGWIIILCFLCGVEGGDGVDSLCVPAAYGEMIFVKYSLCGRLPEGLRLKAVFSLWLEVEVVALGLKVCTVHIACEPCKYLGWWVLASSRDMAASFLGEAALYDFIGYCIILLFWFVRCCRRHGVPPWCLRHRMGCRRLRRAYCSKSHSRCSCRLLHHPLLWLFLSRCYMQSI